MYFFFFFKSHLATMTGILSVSEPHTRNLNVNELHTHSVSVSEPHTCKLNVNELHTHSVTVSEPQSSHNSALALAQPYETDYTRYYNKAHTITRVKCRY